MKLPSCSVRNFLDSPNVPTSSPVSEARSCPVQGGGRHNFGKTTHDAIPTREQFERACREERAVVQGGIEIRAKFFSNRQVPFQGGNRSFDSPAATDTIGCDSRRIQFANERP